ncbi:uncharacterized protein EI97DRAFT_368898 [Westerdykella ornata]|uniref:Tat pathway signal sequence n=1 Tax=Westerdykella ornata TaxID=318751 RepID=A0A6A6JWC0_WESOR|nr:uncharacterized protein EI97DRAFT_368898 [Westerdykella ornata]KAF2280525.1 hypothetical protein EI97DRAFT_368898 [Westerdykella ornata]
MLKRLFQKPAKLSQRQNKGDGGDEALLDSSSSSSDPLEKPACDCHARGARIAIRATLLCTTVYLGIGIWFGYIMRGTQFVADADDFCLNHISHYCVAPLVNEVKPNWRTIQYNGSFFHESIYRQPPSPEVDEAWSALGIDYRSVVVPESEAAKTGLRPDQVKVSQLYGGGYPANVEGLHHLHCLNLLRKALKWNYNYYREQKQGAFVNSEYVVRYHVTHCMDIIRQQLMCTTDIGMLGQVWYHPEGEPEPIPFVDFNTKHRCRDYEAIRQWAESHQLPPESEVDMSRFYEKPKPGDTVYSEIP